MNKKKSILEIISNKNKLALFNQNIKRFYVMKSMEKGLKYCLLYHCCCCCCFLVFFFFVEWSAAIRFYCWNIFRSEYFFFFLFVVAVYFFYYYYYWNFSLRIHFVAHFYHPQWWRACDKLFHPVTKWKWKQNAKARTWTSKRNFDNRK